MNLFKYKISWIKKTGNRIRSFFRFPNKKKKFRGLNLDKKLVYDLSPSKIPNRKQLKHLKRFLNPKEHLLIKICFLLIFINAIYLGVVFLKKHLEYIPVPGGEYIEGVISYPQAINPLYSINRDIDNDLSHLIYSSLFYYNEDGLLVPDLVEEMGVAENRIYTFKIRDGVKWHNGESLTVDDIIFTIEAIKNEDYRSPLYSSFNGVSIEKIDELTFKITLGSPYSPFLDLLTFGILPKSIWSKVNPSGAILSEFNLKPVGSGPYKFKSLTKNKEGELKEYNLVVNDLYYTNKPYIKNIKFKFFVNYQEAIKALNDNQIDGLGYLPFNERQELFAQDSLSLYELVRPQIFAIFFNSSKDKALADKGARVSLAQSLDRDALLREVFDNVYQRADGPILKNNFAYNHSIAPYDYNPEEAAINIKNKLASTTLTVIDSGRNVLVAENIKKQWENIGVSVELKVVSGEKASEIIKNRDFETLLYGESVGGDPDIYSFWHSSQIKTNGLNIAGYNNTEADELLVAARETVNAEERIIKYHKFQENIASDLPAIFLYSPTYTYVQSKQVKGFSGSVIIRSADRFVGISHWYLKTKIKLSW